MVSQFLGDLDLLICDENVKSNLSSPKPFLHAYYFSVSSWTTCFKVFETWKKHFEELLRQDFEEGWLVLIIKISSLQGILVWSFGLLWALRKSGLSFKVVWLGTRMYVFFAIRFRQLLSRSIYWRGKWLVRCYLWNKYKLIE